MGSTSYTLYYGYSNVELTELPENRGREDVVKSLERAVESLNASAIDGMIFWTSNTEIRGNEISVPDSI